MLFSNCTPFILLGMLAAYSNAGPLPIATVASHKSRGLSDLSTPDLSIDGRDTVTTVWRADTRPVKEVIKRGGCFAKSYGKSSANYDLLRHTLGGKDSGFVSTTSSLQVAERWLTKILGEQGVVYEIATYPNLVDVHATLGEHYARTWEKEFAAVGAIRLEQIRGWYIFSPDPNDPTVFQKSEFQVNKRFDKAKYENQPHAGAQHSLSGFPEDSPIWDTEPWKSNSQWRPKGKINDKAFKEHLKLLESGQLLEDVPQSPQSKLGKLRNYFHSSKPN